MAKLLARFIPSRRFAARTARFAARANAIAARHGACDAASVAAAARSAARIRGATQAPSALPLTVHALAAHAASNATCVGCFGARNATGYAINSRPTSSGKCGNSRVAVHISPIRATTVRACRRSARAVAQAAPYRPCVVFAAIIRAMPSAVRGPVHLPPCIRQRPFLIAGARHGHPVVRARAPQRGAAFGLPRRLPFRSCPG
jgi:hypothetical protein